jgi:hypothetical protein
MPRCLLSPAQIAFAKNVRVELGQKGKNESKYSWSGVEL